MKLSTEDYLKKALLDTQERVRDFMDYSQEADDGEIGRFFRDYAEAEGQRARSLQQFVEDLDRR